MSSPPRDLRDQLTESLGADYDILRELFGGGMSRVFLANERTFGRKVVIKVLPEELANSLSVDRFDREVMLSAALQHPNIVPVILAGTSAGLPYYVMPYVEGESLRARLTRGPFSVREVVSVLRDVARALAFAHGRGIVHRDIKPDNVLLSGGTAAVADFGLAKAMLDARRPSMKSNMSITKIGTSVGTPAYMAPEQAAGDPALDHRADLYSLGVLGYEMLVGATPFDGRPPQQMLAAQLTERPPSIAVRRYDVPEGLVVLINQLLEKAPHARPKSAADLVRMLDDPGISSGTFATVARPRKNIGRIYAVCSVAAIAGGAALYLAWRLLR